MRCPRCGYEDGEADSIDVWNLDKIDNTNASFKDWVMTDTDLLKIEEELRKAKIYMRVS